jgi:CRP/FNR family transcriptional regulator, cyclic AMP receptor protein
MSEKTKLWYLENINLFKELSEPELMKIEKTTKMKTIAKGQYIYFPTEPSSSVYFLKQGRIKIGSYSDDGKEIIKRIMQPGEIFGELSLTGQSTRADFAKSLDDDVVICAMQVPDMESLMESNSKLSLKVTKLIGFRLLKMERRLKDVIFKDARTRIIDFLKEMAETEGKKVGFEILVKHRLTHQDIANLTATSRQTVTTVLNDLKEKDLIYLRRKMILIRDINKLE